MTRNIFDLKNAVKESGLSKQEVKHILNEIKKEFPDDQLMYELHVIRALLSRMSRQKYLKELKRVREKYRKELGHLNEE